MTDMAKRTTLTKQILCIILVLGSAVIYYFKENVFCLKTKSQSLDKNKGNEKLMNHLRLFYLYPPQSGPRKLHNRTKKEGDDYSEQRKSSFVDKILNERQNGFFVECGAADGESASNSLLFEIKRNWTGLLIEANPILFRQLLHTKRNAFSINACLSPSNESKKMNFLPYSVSGRLEEGTLPEHYEHLNAVNAQRKIGTPPTIQIQCFTLYSLLLAVQQTHITYLVLDIEGNELDVIATIPFTKVHIEIIQLEYKGPKNSKAANTYLTKIRMFFRDQGLYKEIGMKDQDIFFQKV